MTIRKCWLRSNVLSRIQPWKLKVIESYVEYWIKAFVILKTTGNSGLILLVGVKTGVIMRVALIWNWLGIDWLTELH